MMNKKPMVGFTVFSVQWGESSLNLHFLYALRVLEPRLKVTFFYSCTVNITNLAYEVVARNVLCAAHSSIPYPFEPGLFMLLFCFGLIHKECLLMGHCFIRSCQ